MQLNTKSIQAKALKKDGIRVCIMRRIKPGFVFDIWMPSLAPSTELLKSYHDKKINWDKYEKLFTKQVLDHEEKYLQLLFDVVQKNEVTLLCWERTPDKCHRRLVAEKLQQIFPKLVVKHL